MTRPYGLHPHTGTSQPPGSVTVLPIFQFAPVEKTEIFLVRVCECVCVYYCSAYYKAVRVGGGDSGGHVLRETTSRGLCGLVCYERRRAEACVD